MSYRHPHSSFSAGKRGISMMELLVVLFLIAIVMSLMLPTLSSTRFNARHLNCQNNVKEVGRGFMDFANSYQQRLPGNSDKFDPKTNPREASWLYYSRDPVTRADLNPPYKNAPQSGTLFEFVRHKKLYRCPLIELGALGSGKGSNGMFDYGMLNALYGARIDRLPVNAFFPHPSNVSGVFDVRMMPIIVEEDPAQYVNVHIPGGNNYIEADFSNRDLMANYHRLTGITLPGAAANYLASDGSVQFFRRDGAVQFSKHIWALNTQYGTANFLGFVGPTPWGQWDNGLYAKNKPESRGGIKYGTRVPQSDLPTPYKPYGAP